MIGVDLAFATGQVDPPDRLAAWRELVNRVFLPLAITPLARGDRSGAFRASVTGRGLGGVQVWLIEGSPMSAVRARPHIEASGDDDYLLALHVQGSAHGAQDGREVTLGPGDFALFDSSRPYSISFTGPGVFRHVVFQVPRASLEARGATGAVTARRVPAASRAGQLVSPYLRTLARAGARPQDPGEVFVDAGLDLAAGALRTVAGGANLAGLRRVPPGRKLRDHALAHLGDPGLSPEAVALACYVSVRQLHRVFAREGLTFGGWVREQRLRRCRDDLADPRLRHLTAGQIAARWGFRSAAHFTRAFRARYGVTPASRRGPGPRRVRSG